MVRRKPVGQEDMLPPPLQQAANNPPYPTTPTADTQPPIVPGGSQNGASQQVHPASSFEFIGKSEATKANGDASSDHEDSDSDEWDKDTDDEEEEEHKETPAHGLPAALRAGASNDASPHLQPTAALPPALRAGPSEGFPGQVSQESLVSEHSKSSNPWANSHQRRPSIPLKSNNPYLRMQHSGESNPALASSSSVWADSPAPESQPLAPVELPTHQTPTDAFSQLSLSGKAPPAAANEEPPTPYSRQPPLISVEAENEAEALFQGNAQIPTLRPPVPIAQDFSQSTPPTLPEQNSASPWDDQLRTDEATAKKIEHMEQQNQDPNPWQEEQSHPVLTAGTGETEQPPPKPPRPQVNVPVTSAPERSTTASPNTAAQQQRREHYAIKHVRWFDATAGALRESPILIQNANGPCPLLALVNALVLSSHPGAETALIETLRTREQVSLGLLLDAVFDELMSGRRGGAAQELPDVGDLYQFLITLHTGMNVNPRFVPQVIEAPNLMDADGPLVDVHPALREPGGFEETREMRLYSTFNVPLIHGWLPSKGSEAYHAFDRAAKTFEDAQNIQFREEELDDKLRTSGLTPEEIHLFEDITSIKEFLNRWPTQLTDSGLDVLKRHQQPGSIAIFFRNDHFSTLYKEPKTGRLMSLVTDAGYSTHEEIVWESLVDVNGRGGELFSGDFRPVGGPATGAGTSPSGPSSAGPAGPRSSSARPVQSMLDVNAGGNDGWTTVTGKRRPNRPDALQSHTPHDSGVGLGQELGVLRVTNDDARMSSPVSPSREEQEDHDLALALTLQEEEEDRARREATARREREDRLSQQFLEGEGRASTGPGGPGPGAQDIRPLIPPRRNQGATTPTQVTHTSEAQEDAPPPSYEQASKRPAYHPPNEHPASPSAPVGRGGGPGRGGRANANTGTAYGQNQRRRSSAQIPPGAYPSGSGRGRGAPQYGGIGQGYSQPVGEERDKCTVM